MQGTRVGLLMAAPLARLPQDILKELEDGEIPRCLVVEGSPVLEDACSLIGAPPKVIRIVESRELAAEDD